MKVMFLKVATLCLCAAAFASAAQASQHHIVFGVDGTLVQVVPESAAKEMNPSRIVHVGNKYYHLSDGVEATIHRLLLEPETDVSFFSELPIEATEAILKAIQLPGGSRTAHNSATKILYADLLKDGKKDLSLFEYPLENTLLIDTNADSVVPAQKPNLLQSGNVHFHFETFEKVAPAIEKMKKYDPAGFKAKEALFPETKEAWLEYKLRLTGAYQEAISAIHAVSGKDAKTPSLPEALSALRKANPMSLSLLEAQSAKDLESIAFWDNSTGKAECRDRSKLVSPDRCRYELGTTVAWTTPKAGAPKTCTEITLKEHWPIQNLLDGECLRKLGGYYLFTNSTQTSCGLFDGDFHWVRESTLEMCGLPHVCADPKTGIVSAQVTDLSNATQKIVIANLLEEKKTLARKTSYRALTLDPLGYQKKTPFHPPCFDFMRKTYDSGQSFRSKTLVKALIPLSQEKFRSGEQNLDFFHYTKMDSLLKALAEDGEKGSPQEFEGFFSKVRLSPVNDLVWRTAFYVAEDPKSSKDYGRFKVQMQLRANTQVLRPTPALWKEAYQELNTRFPGLETACPRGNFNVGHGWLGYGDDVYSEIFKVMAEDSGVDLISYGNNADEPNAIGGWYQMLNPLAIESVSTE